MATKKRKIGVLAGVIVVVAAVAAAFWLKANVGLRGKARRVWKENAVSFISKDMGDPNWPASETAQLKSPSPGGIPGNTWITSRLVLMKNGEWMAYRNICRKEDWRIPDLFIGCGSDGKWYYSSFHFCIGMVVPMKNDSPPTLADFVDWYYLKEFDGRSDDCLNWSLPDMPDGVDPKASKRGVW
jgi:hypothetical protein